MNSQEPVSLTVGEVAALVGISVRALHHWDSIGVVVPSRRTSGGYRAYSSADVERIHRVLVFRELGFSLADVAALIDDPEMDEAEQLRRQGALLRERIQRLQHMAEGVDRLLAVREGRQHMGAAEQAEIFGRGWREDWAEEAHDRWGSSDQWAQFEENAARLSADGRTEIREDGEALHRELAAAMATGIEPGSAEANALAERHRGMIGRFYDCTHSMHVCLAGMYTADPRFTRTLDGVAPGLATWLAEAIRENARAHGVDPDTARWE